MILEILNNYALIIFLFFVIAILYSSVGFGGGSSYIAALTLTSLLHTDIKVIALCCNIVVVTGNVWKYHQNTCLNWYKVIPLTIISIPASFLGGYILLKQELFFIILGCTLLIAAVSMWFSKQIALKTYHTNNAQNKNIFFGGVIGFISGMVGIGGGIFLAPLLHLTNWDTSKRIAATASFFILVNSLAGILGQLSSTKIQLNYPLLITLLLTVIIGGQLGSSITNNYFTPNQLKKATALLIAFVSVRILLKYLY